MGDWGGGEFVGREVPELVPAAVETCSAGLPGVYEFSALGRGVGLETVDKSVDDDVRIELQEGLVIADGCPVGPRGGAP